MIRTQCNYCTRMIAAAGGGRTNHMLTHAQAGLVNAQADHDRYEFFETPKGKKVRLGLKRAARMAAKAHK